MDSLEGLVLFIAKSLVDEPGEVSVHTSDKGASTVVELSVGEGDLGKVIGREGRTARAVRTLVSAAAAKQRRRAIVQIVE